ncbi:hypothetical protein SPRG_06298 [Saprolegnia parasitica CBS 223.65]|uniref:BZIP domain-containing protein n=1 Tax=Saprolegnia parasitica (strain CBS 223.65) TaxID=695850 RepID=A0A067CCQ5_SAPPC|nr:hypothetical protein SPRG_06298 [Saprolegnia parasitica CBS 223.65]KDO28248.1 hypothetical protein SPRG_06298 [Saprolegnia parasitica CBS 223.65]|eukprot:XP_012201070.1 hypothetical protein SPRG_06298 [Saprolegnia parasitica CBS 223.65]
MSTSTLHDAEAEKRLKRREQWKINQRNSRLKRIGMAKTLEAQNEAKAKENERLEGVLRAMHQQSLAVLERHPVSGMAAVRVIEEYYRVFSNGFATNNVAQQTLQRNFVRSIMTEDTCFMDTQGAESVLEQWRLMTSSHHTLRIFPLSCELMKEGDGVVVRAISRYMCRISRKTLTTLYPHVLVNERLVQALIGIEVDAIDTVHSYFDDDGRIVRHDVVIDFVSPLLKLLGNVADVASVLSGAHLTSIGLFDIERNHDSPLLRPQVKTEADPVSPLAIGEPCAKRQRRDNDLHLLLSN